MCHLIIRENGNHENRRVYEEKENFILKLCWLGDSWLWKQRYQVGSLALEFTLLVHHPNALGSHLLLSCYCSPSYHMHCPPWGQYLLMHCIWTTDTTSNWKFVQGNSEWRTKANIPFLMVGKLYGSIYTITLELDLSESQLSLGFFCFLFYLLRLF